MEALDKKDLLQYLQTQHLMAIATAGETPWASTVFFVADGSLNLYFVSSPSSNHGKHIAKNSQLAVAIFDSRQQVNDQKIGVQMKGKVVLVTDPFDVGEALRLWNAHNPGFEHIITTDNMANGTIHSKVYKIFPTYAKFFNEKLYGPEGERELFIS